ncbi:hypothetical protein B0G77_4627 [Paraburkholderia sp. BL10I2N1]|nr:hypothetical protein B0G77_4627 [Paraburkholderia sp. BL10I2N1]
MGEGVHRMSEIQYYNGLLANLFIKVGRETCTALFRQPVLQQTFEVDLP